MTKEIIFCPLSFLSSALTSARKINFNQTPPPAIRFSAGKPGKPINKMPFNNVEKKTRPGSHKKAFQKRYEICFIKIKTCSFSSACGNRCSGMCQDTCAAD